MQNPNNTPLYAIVTTDLFGLPNEEPWYLTWQNPVWDDDGYFWTREETFRKVLKEHPENNAQPHQFAFKTEASAKAFADNYKYIHKTNYSIIKLSL